MKSAREEILRKLKAAGKKAFAPRPDMPALNERSLNEEELIAKFTQEISAQTGVVHRVPDTRSALSALTAIVQAEGFKTIMVSNDEVVTALGLSNWGRENSVKVLNSRDFTDRNRFKNAVLGGCQVKCVTDIHTGTRSPNRITN